MSKKSISQAEMTNKIYDYCLNKNFNKIAESLNGLLSQLEYSQKNLYSTEDINFIVEICVRACCQMLKQKKVQSSLLEKTYELANFYSKSSVLICLSKINLAENLVNNTKFEEAKKMIKSIIQSVQNSAECTDLVPKLFLLLSAIYLKTNGKYLKALKYSQKVIDLAQRKVNSTFDQKYYKFLIEAIITKGFYYLKVSDTFQAQKMVD